MHDARGAEREALGRIGHDRNDHDWNMLERRRSLDLIQELPAIHVGQHDVQGNERQRLPRRENQRRLGGRGVQDDEALGLELHTDEVGGLVVVFHDQRSKRSRGRLGWESRDRPGRCKQLSLRRPEREPNREAGAYCYFTFHRHRAAVQVREELDHGQTESRALEFSRQAAINLAERLEEGL